MDNAFQCCCAARRACAYLPHRATESTRRASSGRAPCLHSTIPKLYIRTRTRPTPFRHPPGRAALISNQYTPCGQSAHASRPTQRCARTTRRLFHARQGQLVPQLGCSCSIRSQCWPPPARVHLIAGAGAVEQILPATTLACLGEPQKGASGNPVWCKSLV